MGSLTRIVSPHVVSLTATPEVGKVTLTWPAVTDTFGTVTQTLTRTPPFTGAVNPPGNSYVDTDVTAGVSYTYSLVALDGRGLSSFTPASTATVPNSGTPPIKWHPGHYMQVMRGDSDTVQSTRFGYYDQISSNTSIMGVAVSFRWSQLEGATLGDYTAGINTVTAEINKLKNLSVPKRLFIRFSDQFYGTSGGGASYFPAYIQNSTYAGGFGAISNGSKLKWWNTAVQNRLIALWQAYGAQFNDEPYFEGLFINRETSSGNTASLPADFSNAAFLSGTQAVALAAKTAFSKCNVLVSTNFAPGGQSWVNSLIVSSNAAGIGTGGPDILPPPNNGTNAYKTLQGLSGGHDYRGETPILFSIENSELGGAIGSWTLQELYDMANTTLHCSHVFWDRNTFAGTSAQQWNAIMAFIAANPLTHTAPPSVYGGNVTSA